MDEKEQNHVYQRIGEFVVSFQWIENKLREIGWFILDPARKNWPPQSLRNLTSADLYEQVEGLFLEALPKCKLSAELEKDFRSRFLQSRHQFASLRRARNKILHSAFIELKAGREVQGILRIDPKGERDAETGEILFSDEMLSDKSFEQELNDMAHLGVFYGRCYMQLIARLPAE
ncbi:MAG TPA: hypothetical protein VF651_00715 [Gammaproteobacteria bacterium]